MTSLLFGQARQEILVHDGILRQNQCDFHWSRLHPFPLSPATERFTRQCEFPDTSKSTGNHFVHFLYTGSLTYDVLKFPELDNTEANDVASDIVDAYLLARELNAEIWANKLVGAFLKINRGWVLHWPSFLKRLKGKDLHEDGLGKLVMIEMSRYIRSHKLDTTHQFDRDLVGSLKNDGSLALDIINLMMEVGPEEDHREDPCKFHVHLKTPACD